MDVIDAAEFGGFLDRDSGGLAFWIRGGTTTPTEAPTGNWSTGGAEFLQSNTAEGRCKRVALPGVNIYWRGTQASGNELALRVVAFRHKYRW